MSIVRPKRQTFAFNSHFTLGEMFADFPQEIVKNEPMLFNCDIQTALELGGPITKSFIHAIRSQKPLKGTSTLRIDPDVIDTRVHMLMPGWYPSIPGWHHDDIPRTRSDGQPNYEDPNVSKTYHCMGLVNGKIAPTQFAVNECMELKEVLPGEGNVYKIWHDEVEKQIADGETKRWHAPSNRVIWFDATAMHQGVAAVGNGWRWFGRASWNTTRKPTNEIRRQVQVYLQNPMEGW